MIKDSLSQTNIVSRAVDFEYELLYSMILRLNEILVDLANKIEKKVENKTDYAFLLIYISITLCMKEFFNYPRAKYIQCINKFTQMLILKTFRNNEKNGLVNCFYGCFNF